MLGPIPPQLRNKAKWAKEIFDGAGGLKHIHKLRAWGLKDVLIDKYRFSDRDASDIAAFLLPMLSLMPNDRATAGTMLFSNWLSSDNFNDPTIGEAEATSIVKGWAAEDSTSL